VPDLWAPGFAGPLEALVERIHRRIAQVAEEGGVDAAFVEVELVDGVRYAVESLSADPGYGFVTIRPHAAEDTPTEAIVPVGAIRRIEISHAAEPRTQLGFSVPRT
jgi:hypothetical protein